MRFEGFEERLFGSNARIRVLRYLVRNAGHPQVGYDMAKLLGLSPTQVLKVMADFEKANLVSYRHVGKAKAWEVNTESFAYKQAGKILSYENSPINEVWRILEVEGVKARRNGVVERLWFGSVPKEKEGEESDVDILVVVRTKNDIEKVSECLDNARSRIYASFGKRLSPLVVTKKEYENGTRDGKPPFNDIMASPVYLDEDDEEGGEGVYLVGLRGRAKKKP
jgi:predicted nucleotidyltransferase